MSFFTYYWTGEEFLGRKAHHPEWSLDFAASNQFVKRGVTEGDTVYIWSFLKGQLYLLGRMQVKEICTRAEVKSRYPEIARRYIFWKTEHIVATAESTAVTHFDLVIADDRIHKLRFTGNMAPKIRNSPLANNFDPQTFRGVRQLTSLSALLLDDLLKEHRA